MDCSPYVVYSIRGYVESYEGLSWAVFGGPISIPGSRTKVSAVQTSRNVPSWEEGVTGSGQGWFSCNSQQEAS